MTIICVKDGVMAADSGTFQDNIVRVAVFPKIARSADGAVGAGCGLGSDCWLFNKWMESGRQSEFPKTDSDFRFVLLEANGALLAGDNRGRLTPIPQPYAIGAVRDFAHGAMCAGASAQDAVRLCIEHTDSAWGPVQVEVAPPIMTAAQRMEKIREMFPCVIQHLPSGDVELLHASDLKWVVSRHEVLHRGQAAIEDGYNDMLRYLAANPSIVVPA